MSAFLADSCGARADGSQRYKECGDGSKSYLVQRRESPLRLQPADVSVRIDAGLLNCSSRKEPSVMMLTGHMAKEMHFDGMLATCPSTEGK